MLPSLHRRRARLAVSLLAWSLLPAMYAPVSASGPARGSAITRAPASPVVGTQRPSGGGLESDAARPVGATLNVGGAGVAMTGELRFDAGGGTSGGQVELDVAANPADPPKRATGEAVNGRFKVQIRLAGTYRGGPYGIAEGEATIAGTFADSSGCESRLAGRGTFRATMSGPLGLAELSADWPRVEFEACGLQSPQPFSVVLPPFTLRTEAIASTGGAPPQGPRPVPVPQPVPADPRPALPPTPAPPPAPVPAPSPSVTQYPPPLPAPAGRGTAGPASAMTGPVALAWIGTSADRIGVRGPGADGQPDAEFEIRYARGNRVVKMVNLSMAAPSGQLCCQAWSTAGPQFHFLGVSTPGTSVLANASGFTPILGHPPDALRLHAAAPDWFTPGWSVVATVVFTDETYISGSTIIGGGLPFPGPVAGAPGGAGQGPGPGVASLLGMWTIACCNDALNGTLTITQQQAGAFSGVITGNMRGDIVNGQVRGNLVEFDRLTDEGPQRWSGRLAGGGADLRIVGGTWSGAYQGRFAAGQHNWHAEKQR